MNKPRCYGPYLLPTGHIFWVDVAGSTRKTVLLHRELMEKHIGRRLRRNEVVHHKNEDPTDNRIENLEVMTRRKHVRHHHQKAETAAASCPQCGKAFTVLVSSLRYHQGKRGSTGPFCGKSCSGKSTSTWARRNLGPKMGPDSKEESTPNQPK